MTNILLVEKDLNYCREMINHLNKELDNIRVIGIVRTTLELIEYLKDFNIDIILMNENIYDYSILSNSNIFKQQKYDKSIILMLDNINSSNVIIDNSLIYDYFLREDNIKNIIKKINNLISIKNTYFIHNSIIYKENEDIINQIKNEMKYLHFNFLHNGSKYLLESIFLLTNYDNYYNVDLERDIYPIIAKKYNTTPHNIKCNIINATNIMYCECEEDKLIDYVHEYCVRKPGPKKIIIAILEKIKVIDYI